jgi:hypothetical protein
LAYLKGAELQLNLFRDDTTGKHLGEALRCMDVAASYLMGQGMITSDGERRGPIPDPLEELVSKYESVLSQFMDRCERFVIYSSPETRH